MRILLAACLTTFVGCTSNSGPSLGDGMVRFPDDAQTGVPDAWPYVPHPGDCGLGQPAFCDTFEAGPVAGGRMGDLDPARWSVSRDGLDPAPTVNGAAFVVKPVRMPACRAGVPAIALPDSDVAICDPTASIATRHLLTANGAQNYGMLSHRIRQPFDFAGRAGAIHFDVELSGSPLCGFSSLALAEAPTPSPNFNEWEHSSGPRNGIEVVFDGDNCHSGASASPSLHLFKDYVETVMASPDRDPSTCVQTAKGRLNRVSLVVSKTTLEVWASDASTDGETFGDLRKLWSVPIALTFERGYISLNNHNHATLKYWCGGGTDPSGGSGSFIRWDNIGFDGPIVTNWREYSVQDSLTAYTGGLDGCMVGGVCTWRADVVAANATDVCPPAVQCSYSGEARNVGYVLLNGSKNAVRLTVDNVDVSNVVRAQLTLAANYIIGKTDPSVSMAMGIQYSINGGPLHDRYINAVEANAFAMSQGAGTFNQVIDLDASELHAGTNTIDMSGLGGGSYPIGVTNLDLILGM